MAKKQPQPKNNKRTMWTALAIAAGALVLLALCLWLFRPGPLDQVRSAAKKTFFAESFTIQYDLTVNGESMDGVINTAINKDEKQVQMYMRLTTNVGDYECGIYNNTFVVYNGSHDKITTVDITDRMNNFFAALEYNGQPDWSVLLDLDGTNLHETLTEDFDFDVFLSCLGKWLDKTNDTGWAKKYAGYNKEKINGITTYRYSPDPYTLATQTAPMFKKAFLDSQRYQALLDYMDDAKYLLGDGKADVSFGVENGRLVAAELTLQYYNTDISGNLQFIGIGNTVVDTDTVAYYIEEANN
ncbi:MAG: hypothetical protein IJZ56_00875 [Oscillospiraceae bacterium]|nr:hypothetical protein [Oscillospiraceae bacterium]